MWAFGFAILAAGIVGLLAAMNMDVSVSSGLGRVSNIGLMAQRQNYMMIAGLAVLAGLLMVIFGSKKTDSASDGAGSKDLDTRSCPFCAETIKNAAIRCKHCGADIDSAAATASSSLNELNAKSGWTVRFDCAEKEEMEKMKNRVAEMPGAILKDDGMTVVTGFFLDKDDAKEFRNRFSMKNGIDGELNFQTAPKLNA